MYTDMLVRSQGLEFTPGWGIVLSIEDEQVDNELRLFDSSLMYQGHSFRLHDAHNSWIW